MGQECERSNPHDYSGKLSHCYFQRVGWKFRSLQAKLEGSSDRRNETESTEWGSFVDSYHWTPILGPNQATPLLQRSNIRCYFRLDAQHMHRLLEANCNSFPEISHHLGMALGERTLVSRVEAEWKVLKFGDSKPSPPENPDLAKLQRAVSPIRLHCLNVSVRCNSHTPP